MLTWQPLQAGDKIAIIAPSARYSGNNLDKLKTILASWQLQAVIPPDLQGDDILCANTDAQRFKHLKNALLDHSIKAIWCLRGGYGCARLIPELEKLPIPNTAKLFIGFSDITVLHTFLQQCWNWPTLHAPVAGQLADELIPAEVINQLQDILFGRCQQLSFQLQPMNQAAERANTLEAVITGGNLCLLETSLGTSWEIEAKGKILLLEEVGERGYRIDRMLVHLQQAGIFSEVKAVLLGDFTGGLEADDSTTIPQVLQRFAKDCATPVLRCPNIGHGTINQPIALGMPSVLKLGNEPSLLATLSVPNKSMQSFHL